MRSAANPKLTQRQLNFACEYLVDFNATQAAIRARYSAKTAYSLGQRLLKNAEIAAEIARRQAKQESRLEITADRVLLELARMAFADTSQIATIKRGKVRIVDTEKLSKDVTASIAQIKQGASGIEVRQHDKLRALEMLGRHLALFAGRGADDGVAIEGFEDGEMTE